MPRCVECLEIDDTVMHNGYQGVLEHVTINARFQNRCQVCFYYAIHNYFAADMRFTRHDGESDVVFATRGVNEWSRCIMCRDAYDSTDDLIHMSIDDITFHALHLSCFVDYHVDILIIDEPDIPFDYDYMPRTSKYDSTAVADLCVAVVINVQE